MPIRAAVVGVVPVVTVGGGMPRVRHSDRTDLAGARADAMGEEGCATDATQVLPDVLARQKNTGVISFYNGTLQSWHGLDD